MKPLKLHLCCGDVYLKGYVNIDRVCFRYTPKPTTLKNYYKGKVIGKAGPILCDRSVDLCSEFPLKDYYGKCSEVVMINGIEHFAEEIAQNIVKEIYLSLLPGGKFIFDFPDMRKLAGAISYVERCKAYPNEDAIMRLIFGSSRNSHKWGYTKNTIKLLFDPGWDAIEFKTVVPHPYPSIGVVATKL